MSLLIRSFNSKLCFSLLVSRFCSCPVFILDSQIISARVFSLSLQSLRLLNMVIFLVISLRFLAFVVIVVIFNHLRFFVCILFHSPKPVLLTTFC